MRMSDWSSDVCSSVLAARALLAAGRHHRFRAVLLPVVLPAAAVVGVAGALPAVRPDRAAPLGGRAGRPAGVRSGRVRLASQHAPVTGAVARRAPDSPPHGAPGFRRRVLVTPARHSPVHGYFAPFLGSGCRPSGA